MIILIILGFLSLWIPLFWELFNDKDGDEHHSQDVAIRIIIAIAASVFNTCIALYSNEVTEYANPTSHFIKRLIASLMMSGAIHFFFFDYAIAYILGHTKTWFAYLGKKSVIDQQVDWRGATPWGRFAARAVVLIFAVLTYITEFT